VSTSSSPDPRVFERAYLPPSVGGSEPVTKPRDARDDDLDSQDRSRSQPSARPYHCRLFVELCRPADAAVALLVFGVAFVLVNADEMPNGPEEFLLLRLTLGNLLTLGSFAYAWQLLFLSFGLYDSSEPRSLRQEAPSVAGACTLGALVSLLPIAWSESGAYSFTVVLIAWPLTMVATLLVRWVARQIAERAQERPAQRVVIVGSGPLALNLYDRVAHDRTLAYDVLGFVDTNDDVRSPTVKKKLLGSLDELERFLMRTVVDEVLIALPIKSHYAEIQRTIEECERAGVQSRYSADFFPSRLARPHLATPDGQPAIAMKVVSDDYRLAVKRAIDIAAAAAGMVLLIPVFAVIAIAVKATSRGPAIFGQERYGWRKRRFTMYKFRTMVVDADVLQDSLESRNEAAGPVFKIKDDPRVTPIGRFLRKSSLDELPQLWNVLRGEMSLVGPRPLPLRDVRQFENAWLMRRFSVVPGMTGLWQVSGRSDLSFEDWIQLDLRYIDRWSLRLDAELLLRTIPAVVWGQGAK
jgi:exopolysaccharide biosynthesis polyprenyl glycosylphosphotransferase